MLNKLKIANKVLNILYSGAEDKVIQAKLKKLLATVAELDLNFQYLKDNDVWHLAVALKHNKSVQILDLSNNKIEDVGAWYLGIVLQNNKAIQTLKLANNKITAEGAEEIANALEKNNTIQILNLRGNNIQSEGFEHFARALITNQTLQSLSLCSYLVDDEAKQKMLNTLEFHNPTITSLGPNFDKNQKFQAILEQNKAIQESKKVLVKMHSELPQQIYNNVVEAANTQSMLLHNTRLLSVLCKDIYQNNSDAKIFSCPIEILYKIAEMHNKTEFQANFDKMPSAFWRAKLEEVMNQIKEEISK